MTESNQPSKEAAFVIVRQFSATQSEVFDAFANPESMAAWWGPAEHSIDIIKFDFTPGGLFHYKIEMNGQEMYGRFVYGRIVPSDLLEFTNSFSDENAGIVRAPFSAEWPLEVFNSLHFSEQDGKTTLKMSGYPVNPTEAEIKMFTTAQANVKQGMEGTFARLDELLKSKQ
jgi:uncharacterized protein YndB with AHSA1/START domain